MAINFGDVNPYESVCADVFDFLKDNDDKFDMIILDPPAFAKHRGALNNALQAYKRLNAAAFTKLKQGGILFTFSCSQVVSRDQFRNAVFSGSIIANRNVRIMHQLTQPADHPINIYHPEGEYLKGLVLYVD
jgi:23S rRNA (cytosine1962-C5)-methyltransferase